jgi:hypothetical protein
VTADWSPYSCGHWLWTDRGWMWVGYEPFGWVVYHYGYWAYDPGLGWLWVPGVEWSPARVRWRVWGDYVSWSPLPPPGLATRGPIATGDDRWTTVPVRSFTRDNVGNFRTLDVTVRRGGPTSDTRAPEVGVIERTTDQHVQQVSFATERVRQGGRTLERIKLPPSEEERLTANRSQVEQRYLRRGPERSRGPQATPVPSAPAAPPPAGGTRTQSTPPPPSVPAPPAVQQPPRPRPPNPSAQQKPPATPRPPKKERGTRATGKGKETRAPETNHGKQAPQNKAPGGTKDRGTREGERREPGSQDAK